MDLFRTSSNTAKVEFTPGFARTAIRISVAEMCPIEQQTGELIRGYFFSQAIFSNNFCSSDA
jgi:hypothetical protein